MKCEGRQLFSMGRGLQRFVGLLALQALIIIQCMPSSADATIGVVYGYDADNLPIPSQVVQLLTNNFVTQVRIYDTNAAVLKAFEGSNIEVIVGVANDELATVGASNATATAWVTEKVVPFAKSVNITAIAVGNEVLTMNTGFSASLYQTMVWIHNALILNGLDLVIRVSTPLSTDVLQSSFPPSQSIFNKTMLPYVQNVLQFINLTGSYLMLNVHTFDVFQANSGAVSLDYVLFQAEDTPVRDAYSNLNYTCLLDALVDATYYAMEAISFTNVRIVVSETGWPTQGDSNENGANRTNAQIYNTNLALRVKNGSVTPYKPLILLQAYVYELFNEDLLTGPTSVRNFGLFENNLQPVYNVDLTGEGRLLTSNGTEYQTWCVAVQDASPQDLQAALDWACGQGNVNCSATQLGGLCYSPNTLESHATWVFNAYYQQNGDAPNTCNFNGVAQIVSSNPSYGSCIFQASNTTTTVNGSSIPPSDSNTATPQPLQFWSGFTVVFLVGLFVLNLRYLLG